MCSMTSGTTRCESFQLLPLCPEPKSVKVIPDADGSSCHFDFRFGLKLSADSHIEVVQALLNIDVAVDVAVASEGCASNTSLVLLDSSNKEADSYTVLLRDGRAIISASSLCGLFYGALTLCQLCVLYKDNVTALTVPPLYIEDAASYRVRGVMLDVSRCRVPTLDHCKSLIRQLAYLKINHVQFYTEHTFAYSRHEEVWCDSSPMTASEIREIDLLCRTLFIDLVPNQAVLGHFHRWLKLPKYRHLAEYPEGICHPLHPDGTTEPWSMNPCNPACLDLVEEMMDELLPCFSSEHVNLNMDEAFDLAWGECKAVARARGKGQIYLEWVLKVNAAVEKHGKKLLIWGDMFSSHPQLLPRLPENITVLEWGYESNHPFCKRCARLQHAGLDFFVCPGTSSWLSLSGRTDNAVNNILCAAKSGAKYGAKGLLCTDWGDLGHLQPPCISFLGFVCSATLSWNPESSVNKDVVCQRLDSFVLCDSAKVMGCLLWDLGNVYQTPQVLLPNLSILYLALTLEEPLFGCNRIIRGAGEVLIGFDLFSTPLDLIGRIFGSKVRYLLGMHEANFIATRDQVGSIVETLHSSAMSRLDADLIIDEISFVVESLRFAADMWTMRVRAGLQLPIIGCPSDERLGLASRLADIIETCKKLWVRRSRPGGLSEAIAPLQRVRDALEQV